MSQKIERRALFAMIIGGASLPIVFFVARWLFKLIAAYSSQ
jgi:hypothetical protein